jgi:hypothetical protein
MTLFQRQTPPELMGRTDAAFTFCYAVPQTVAIAAGAGLIAAVSYRVMLLIIAAIMTLAAGYLATRRLARLRRKTPLAVRSGCDRPLTPSGATVALTP